MSAVDQKVQTDKVWTRESVLDLINNNDQAVVRALLTLYSRQTTDEQATDRTRVRNNRGFNARDAAVLSDIAKRLPRYDNRLTERQLMLVRGRIRKYVGQLLDAIEEKGGIVVRTTRTSVTADDESPVTDPEIQKAASDLVLEPQAINERVQFGTWA